MTVGGFFILLAFAILIRRIGNKLIPPAMPGARFKTIVIGWVGGFAGSLVNKLMWELGLEVGGIYLEAAAIGCFLFILFFGAVPFIKILLGKPNSG